MANDKITQNYKNIADAIRNKTGENAKMTANEMPQKIAAIKVPYKTDMSIFGDGTFDVTEYKKVHIHAQNAYWFNPNYYKVQNGSYLMANVDDDLDYINLIPCLYEISEEGEIVPNSSLSDALSSTQPTFPGNQYSEGGAKFWLSFLDSLPKFNSSYLTKNIIYNDENGSFEEGNLDCIVIQLPVSCYPNYWRNPNNPDNSVFPLYTYSGLNDSIPLISDASDRFTNLNMEDYNIQFINAFGYEICMCKLSDLLDNHMHYPEGY